MVGIMKKIIYLIIFGVTTVISLNAYSQVIIVNQHTNYKEEERLREEKNALLEADIIIDLNKLIEKCINKSDITLFLAVLDKLKYSNTMFPKLTQEDKDKYLDLITKKMASEKVEHDAPLTFNQMGSVIGYSAASLASLALMIRSYYDVFTKEITAMSQHGFVCRVMSPMVCAPASVFLAIAAKRAAYKEKNLDNIANLKKMHSILAITQIK